MKTVFWGLASFMLLTKLCLANDQPFMKAEVDSTIQWLEEHLYEDSIRHTLHTTALEIAATLQSPQQKDRLAKVHQLLADWHDYYNEFGRDSALYHQQKALELYQSGGDQKSQAEAHISLSGIYINQSNFKLAEEQIFKALAIFESLGDQNGQGVAYRKIAQIYMVTEAPERALEYDRRALELLKATEDHYNTCLSLMNMTMSYNQLKEYDKALAAADECLQILEDENMDQFGIEARMYAFRGDSYRDLKNYDAAKADYTKAWEIIKSVVGEERATEWEMSIAEVMVLQENYAEALPILLRATQVFEEREYVQQWIPYPILIECYKGLGDYENALIYAEKLTAARDSMYARQIENLEAEGLLKYESGKKDEAIAQRDELIRQKNQVQLLSFSLAGLFAVMLASLFYNFRKNKRQSRQLALLNSDLETRNQEKEVLLKEIHHRVKNNLQLISSLLSLQSFSIGDHAVKNAILDSQSRVKSMSLIHQKLYRGDNLAAVKMKNYFETLSDSLVDAYAEDFENVEVNLEMNNIELDVDHAIPLGLITNELITNSLKYAFPDKRPGVINIHLDRDQERLVLEVSDNGVGPGKAASSDEFAGGFGSELVEMLTQQLRGTLEQEYASGFCTRITFPYAKMAS